MHTTNYVDTFIAVAPDSRAVAAEAPPSDPDNPSIAARQFALLHEHPYEFTSDDVIFTVYADRAGIAEEDRERAREEFFSRGQACLRSSALGKRYGWGTHHDAQGRVALVPMGSDEYAELSTSPQLRQTAAMRSRRG
ncbi:MULTISPECIES: DUF6157 family protein [Microbacterium]|jgi:hypothetical protein|uniref:DUF6157 family protein n=1 Tax=Microbacterium TaxID=33882 RepID=UPI001E570ED2|nr:DUF6157 family protein [Microbacterium nymphoidis]MCD2498763.1 DUF6157 family protein [Microbacterium nymphoidis]